jgi:hypothetical protein
MRYLLLPILANPDEAHLPSDSPALLDHIAASTRHAIETLEQSPNGQLPEIPVPTANHLSKESNEFADFVTNLDYLNGQLSQQSFRHAASEVAAGRPAPVEPISGEPFNWNPETRELSAPDVSPFTGNGKWALTIP